MLDAAWLSLMQEDAAGLVAAARDAFPPSVASTAALRRSFASVGPTAVAAALSLAEARQRAVAKFGKVAEELWADVDGVQMASTLMAARHKAERFAVSADERGGVADLCCGVGADAMAMAERLGRDRVVAVDLDPVRAAMTARNAGCRAITGDAVVEARRWAGEWGRGGLFHLDPARRETLSGRRLHGLDELLPGPVAWREIMSVMAGGCIKLAPGTDAEDLDRVGLPTPCIAPREAALEYVSEQGSLTQALLWVGTLAACGGTAGTHVATRLPEGLSLAGQPRWPEGHALRTAERRALGRYLLAPDPAIERARLLPLLGALLKAELWHPAVGLFTADSIRCEGAQSAADRAAGVAVLPLPHALANGGAVKSEHQGSAWRWVRAFEVLAEMAWEPRRVKAWLRSHEAGIVEVKTRGKAVDPDRVQQELRGTGDRMYTLFVLRTGTAVRAVITARVVRCTLDGRAYE